MRIIGYSYDADVHCIDCTVKYLKASYPEYVDQKVLNWGNSSTMGLWLLLAPLQEDHDPELDECPEPEDSEGNALHPMWDIDEGDPAGEYCGDCGTCISEPWEGDDDA